MKNNKWVGIFLVLLLLVTAIPAITMAKTQKKMANGVVVQEPPEKEVDKKQQAIAECGFSRPMRVATFSNNRPFGWAEYIMSYGATKLVSRGFGIELFDALAKKLNIKYEAVGYTKDEQAITDLKRGNLDLLIGVYTPQQTIGKGATPIFPAIFTNVFSVYSPKDKRINAKDYDDLKDKKGIVRRSEHIYPLLSSHITEEMSVSLDNTESALKKLITGEADYLIGSPYSIEAELRRYKLHEYILPSDKGMFETAMFMVITRNTDCIKLRKLLNETLVEYQKDPNVTEKLIRKVIDEWGERFRETEGMDIKAIKAAAEEEKKEQDEEENPDEG